MQYTFVQGAWPRYIDVYLDVSIIGVSNFGPAHEARVAPVALPAEEKVGDVPLEHAPRLLVEHSAETGQNCCF